MTYSNLPEKVRQKLPWEPRPCGGDSFYFTSKEDLHKEDGESMDFSSINPSRVLNSGRVIFFGGKFVWCDRCREIREIEVLPNMEDLEKRLLDPEMDANATREEMEWLKRRQAPLHCLECGSQEFREVLSDADLKSVIKGEPVTITHPVSGKEFLYEGEMFTSDGYGWPSYIDEEGLNIRPPREVENKIRSHLLQCRYGPFGRPVAWFLNLFP